MMAVGLMTSYDFESLEIESLKVNDLLGRRKKSAIPLPSAKNKPPLKRPPFFDSAKIKIRLTRPNATDFLRRYTDSRVKAFSKNINKMFTRHRQELNADNIEFLRRYSKVSPRLKTALERNVFEFTNEFIVKEWEAAVLNGREYITDEIQHSLSRQFPKRSLEVIMYELAVARRPELTLRYAQSVIDSLEEAARYFNNQEMVSDQYFEKQMDQAAGITHYDTKNINKRRRNLAAAGVAFAAITGRTSEAAKQAEAIRVRKSAISEMASAWNTAVHDAVKDLQNTGIISGEVYKMWETADDEYVCPICNGLDGQIIEIDATFPLSGFWASGNGPPAHVSCRCSFSFHNRSSR